MNDKGKDFSNLQPLGLSRLNHLEYLNNKVIEHWKRYNPNFPEEQVSTLTLNSIDIEKAIDETIAFLMCNIVVPAVRKQFLNVLKDLNRALEMIMGELKKLGCLENREEILLLNQKINREVSDFPGTPEPLNFLPDALDIKKEILDHIKGFPSPTNDEKHEGNKYPRIFTNEGFRLFEHLIRDIEGNSPVADCSFLFFTMKEEGYIYDGVTHSEYFTVLDQYGKTIDQLKQVYQTGKYRYRKSIYENAKKELFQ